MMERRKQRKKDGKTLSVLQGDSGIPFRVKYSPRRRTIQIAVEAPGIVTVTAPSRRSNRELVELVSQKERWIARKLAMMKTAQDQLTSRDLASGSSILYQGREVALVIEVNERVKKPVILLRGNNCRIVSNSDDPEKIKPHLAAWYREQAAEKVGGRIRWFAPQIGVAPKQVQIRDQKKRWGSCTSAGRLYINWRCILAPEPVLDYIVVHELCHLLVMNHSPRFWANVKTVLPDFETRRKWLRTNGINLDF
jgi:predicted metal-dependent hydrolase